MGEAQAHHFNDFRDFRARHQTPKPIIFVFGYARIPNKNQENQWDMFKQHYLYKYKNVGNSKLCHFSKRWDRRMMKIRVNKS